MLIIGCVSAFAVDIKVHISISSSNEEGKRALKSFISREIRTLGDVVIVRKEEDADFSLQTILIKLSNGYVLSYFILYYPRKIYASMALIDEIPNPFQKILRYLSEKIIDELFTGSFDSLRGWAEHIVVELDSACDRRIR